MFCSRNASHGSVLKGKATIDLLAASQRRSGSKELQISDAATYTSQTCPAPHSDSARGPTASVMASNQDLSWASMRSPIQLVTAGRSEESAHLGIPMQFCYAQTVLKIHILARGHCRCVTSCLCCWHASHGCSSDLPSFHIIADCSLVFEVLCILGTGDDC